MRNSILIINAFLLLMLSSCKKSNIGDNTNASTYDASFFTTDTSGKVYKNGTAVFSLPTPSRQRYGIFISDSMDVFVLTTNGDFYKNNTKIATFSMPTNSFYSPVFYVSGNDLYVGGGESYTHNLYGNHYRPVIYKNGVKQIMYNAPGGTVVGQATMQYVSSIFVLGGNVYASGLSHVNAISGLMIPPSFIFWKNGELVTYSNALTLDNIKPYVIPNKTSTPQMLYLEKTGSSSYILRMLNGGQGYSGIFDPASQIIYSIATNNNVADIIYTRPVTGSDYKADIISNKSGNKLGARSFDVVRSLKVFLSSNNDEFVIANVRELNGAEKTIMFKNGVDYTPPVDVNTIVTIK